MTRLQNFGARPCAIVAAIGLIYVLAIVAAVDLCYLFCVGTAGSQLPVYICSKGTVMSQYLCTLRDRGQRGAGERGRGVGPEEQHSSSKPGFVVCKEWSLVTSTGKGPGSVACNT